MINIFDIIYVYLKYKKKTYTESSFMQVYKIASSDRL